MKRSTYAGIGGLLGSLGTAALIPPEVMQEIFKLVFGANISVSFAAWLGSMIAVTVAFFSARYAPNQPTPPLPTEPGAK